MHRFLFILLAIPLLSLAQTRTDTFNAGDVEGTGVNLRLLPDGGCLAQDVCGRLVSVDGGTTLQGCSAGGEIQNAARRTTCLNVLGLAGTTWLRSQNIGIDGGL